MKKIVLIGILSIVLAGCDDTKATKEKFFLGKWHCNEDLFEKKIVNEMKIMAIYPIEKNLLFHIK